MTGEVLRSKSSKPTAAQSRFRSRFAAEPSRRLYTDRSPSGSIGWAAHLPHASLIASFTIWIEFSQLLPGLATDVSQLEIAEVIQLHCQLKVLELTNLLGLRTDSIFHQVC
jgi:hypothetical protein